MVVQTFASLGIFIVALLPGALYVWGFERFVGPWGIRLTDRLIRFVGISALFHALFLPATYGFWSDHVRTGRLGSGDASWAVWPLALAYVLVPLGAGTLVGHGTVAGARWARLFTGVDPAPRAWDYLFGHRPDGWMRLRLKSGVWIGGVYGTPVGARRSYAASYPEAQDLFLSHVAELDPSTGIFLLAEDGSIRLTEASLLVRWDEVEYLEFTEV